MWAEVGLQSMSRSHCSQLCVLHSPSQSASLITPRPIGTEGAAAQALKTARTIFF